MICEVETTSPCWGGQYVRDCFLCHQMLEDFPETKVASHERCEAAAQDSRGSCVDSRDTAGRRRCGIPKCFHVRRKVKSESLNLISGKWEFAYRKMQSCWAVSPTYTFMFADFIDLEERLFFKASIHEPHAVLLGRRGRTDGRTDSRGQNKERRRGTIWKTTRFTMKFLS